MDFFDDSKRAKVNDVISPEFDRMVETKHETNKFELELSEPQWKIPELILADDIKKSIVQAANTILAAPIVEQWLGNRDRVGRRVAVNFYGPPGTGKTSAVDALAAMLSLKIMRVNYADLESRFIGETPKNIRFAFHEAGKVKALLFFDEADSILSRRFTNISQSNESYINQSRSVMMMELDKFQGVVAFATNLQENYDDAFVRRIVSHIRFSLPDKQSRIELWKMYMPDTLPMESDISFEKLADLSEQFSPADIAMVVRQSATVAAVREDNLRKVTFYDLEKIIEKVYIAKKEVGHKKTSFVESNTKIISKQDIPDELKSRLP